MTKPMIRIHNTETNEITDREMTNAEFAQYETDNAIDAVKQAEIEAKAKRKAKAIEKLKALGLTEDEVTSLI